MIVYASWLPGGPGVHSMEEPPIEVVGAGPQKPFHKRES